MTWVDDTRSNTTFRNTSYFIQPVVVIDPHGGVDFQLAIRYDNPFHITNDQSVPILDDPSEDP